MAHKVSVLIPARNEIYLEQTIRNVLDNARGDIEILVALDGWIPDPQIVIGDNRVQFYHFKDAIGHRAATNRLAEQAKGKFIFKLDAHCAVGEGFDVILAEDCEYDWTVIPRMYNLDVETWKPKEFENYDKAVRRGKCNDYLYIAVNEKGELRTEYYSDGRVTYHMKRKDKLIDDTMSCMGPGFFMHKDRFFELDGCDEWMGGWGQQAVEVACKAWLSGGSLKVNKKTWFAHWFRHKEGWPYPVSGKQINRTRRDTTDHWLNAKWPKAKRKFKWMVDKFDPPGWQEKQIMTPEETERIINASFSWRKRNVPWYPRRGRREHLGELFAKLGFKKGVEVGTRQGEYSEILLKVNPDLHMTCVDSWEGKHERHHHEAIDRLSKYNTTLVHKRSMDAVDSFNNESLDFVYIDADHDFDNAMLDIIKWTPKVKKGGIVGVHDFVPAANDVIWAVEAYTKGHDIRPWYTTREQIPTAFWVKK